MRPTPYVASLRVYEPISSFEPADRLRWSTIAASENSSRTEQILALRRVISPESPALRPDGAHVIDVDNARYVSPWSTATRCWAAMEDFKSSLPSSVSSLFIPERVEEVMTSGFDFVESKVPHILTQNWIIPPRWFTLFVPEERVRGRDSYGPFTVVRTTLANAKTRCLTTHGAVRNAFGPGQVEEELQDLGNWLDNFHPESFLELDYGGLAEYLESALVAKGEAGLAADTSIEDVLSSVSGLASGDGAVAGRGYERLVTRWREVAAFEQAM